jgi:hypothetical protein
LGLQEEEREAWIGLIWLRISVDGRGLVNAVIILRVP